MKPFIDEQFLLFGDTAKRLYHDYAEKMPIIDYHCHINPREIYEDRKFENITEAWLGADHYKWRIIRSIGVEEAFVTGDADPREKFRVWAKALSRAIGNPLYAWTHLELKRYFGYDGILNEKTADEVYDLCNEKLKTLTVRKMITQANVKVICTTDDPIDSLEWHQKLRAEKDLGFQILPAWRPDKGVSIAKPGFAEYIEKLSACCGINIQNFEDLKAAYLNRLDFFEANGCANSDHGVDALVYVPATVEEVDGILRKALSGQKITLEEAAKYQTALLLFLTEQYSRRGWVMQIHQCVMRNLNPLKFEKLGPDTGFDAISNRLDTVSLAAFLSEAETRFGLPKTILYSANPADNDAIVSICQCFSAPGIGCRVIQGSAWWFNDTREGMIAQMTALANIGVLGQFLGMLTDSRSFLSYTRHEYFRRILCNLLGEWVDRGEYPADFKTLGRIVEDICFYNTKRFFGFQI